MIRAVTLGAVKMATYDQSKVLLDEYGGMRKGGMMNTAFASLLTSANTVLFSAPVDFLRTQARNAPEGGYIIGCIGYIGYIGYMECPRGRRAACERATHCGKDLLV